LEGGLKEFNFFLSIRHFTEVPWHNCVIKKIKRAIASTRMRRATETTNERVVHDEMVNFNLIVGATQDARLTISRGLDEISVRA
jgi:hypothetical protein